VPHIFIFPLDRHSTIQLKLGTVWFLENGYSDQSVAYDCYYNMEVITAVNLWPYRIYCFDLPRRKIVCMKSFQHHPRPSSSESTQVRFNMLCNVGWFRECHTMIPDGGLQGLHSTDTIFNSMLCVKSSVFKSVRLVAWNLMALSTQFQLTSCCAFRIITNHINWYFGKNL